MNWTAKTMVPRWPVGRIVRLIGLLLVSMVKASAQSYTLESFAVGGGGGTSSGGTYSVSGTIGQLEVGTFSGGDFTLEGGFWAVVSEVVASGPPELTIRSLSDGSLQICWPRSAEFELQDSASLDSFAWLPSSFVPVDDGATHCVIVPPTNGSRFYRLAR